MTTQLQVPTLPSSSQHLIAKGTLQLYITPNRGACVPVMAQALRIAGQGTPALVVQFLKGGIQQGPDHVLRLGRYLEWVRCGIERCVDTPHLEPQEQLALDQLWAFTQTAIQSDYYGLVVLDELGLAIKLGLIPEAEVLDLLDHRPISLDVMITGPDMSESLLERADQITQLKQR